MLSVLHLFVPNMAPEIPRLAGLITAMMLVSLWFVGRVEEGPLALSDTATAGLMPRAESRRRVLGILLAGLIGVSAATLLPWDIEPAVTVWASVLVGFFLYHPVAGLLSLMVFTDFMIVYGRLGLLGSPLDTLAGVLLGLLLIVAIIRFSNLLIPVANVVLWFFSKATVFAYSIAFLLLLDFINQMPVLRGLIQDLF